MGRAWLRRFPFVRQLYEEVRQCGEGLPACGSLAREIFRDRLSATPETLAVWEDRLRETRRAQPAIVLSSMAAYEVLRFFGLQPQVVIGHSLGEISALAAAGAWDPLTAVRLAALRGQVMSTLAPPRVGGMVAVAAPAPKVRKLLALLDSTLVISGFWQSRTPSTRT